MHYKVIVALAVLTFVTVESGPVQRAPLELVNFIALEEPCVRQGGLCRLIEDCPQGNLVQMRGVLCPKHRHLGVECCYV
ncbi:unnamed protein product, partial [Iphiclides podalirius]